MDWIFSHIDDLDAEAAMDISEGRSAADSISESVPVGPKVRDGPGSECPWETGQWYLASQLPDPHSKAALPPVGAGGRGGGGGQKLLSADRASEGGILGVGDRLVTQYMPHLP